MNTNSYTLSIGLKDKDNFHVIPSELAKDIVINSIMKEYEGCTVFDCIGYYKNNEGIRINEPSLSIVINDYEGKGKEGIIRIINELKVSLNQESIGITESIINSSLI